MSGYWDRVSAAYTHDDAATQRKAELGFVQRTGVLPDTLKRKYQGALLSSDPAVAVSGAEAITKLAAMDPALVADIPVDHQQRANTIARYADLDLPPDRAVQLAEIDVEKGAAKLTDAGNISASRQPSVAAARTDSALPSEEQIAQVEDAPSPPPSWDQVHDLEKRLQEDGEEAFTAEARKAGLDPERVRLFIDILKATPADRDAIVKRIQGLYGQTGALLLQEQLDKFISFGDVEARQKGLDDRRQGLNADAREREARQERAYGLVRGIVGGFGGRKAGPGSRSGKPMPVRRMPPGPGFKLNCKFITPEEFRKLPDKGVIDPQRIRTSQRKFNEEFGKPFIPGLPESKKIDFLVEGLKNGKIKPQAVEPIQIIEWHGHIYSVDHRRLIAFRRAGIEIPFEKVRLEDLSIDKKKRVRGAPYRNDNGAFIPNEVTGNME